MIKQTILTEEDYPITIKYHKGQAAKMFGIKEAKCAFCKKTFYLHWKDKVINKQVICSFCGKINVNKSDINFELVKGQENESISSIDGKISTTSKKNKTTKNK